MALTSIRGIRWLDFFNQDSDHKSQDSGIGSMGKKIESTKKKILIQPVTPFTMQMLGLYSIC